MVTLDFRLAKLDIHMIKSDLQINKPSIFDPLIILLLLLLLLFSLLLLLNHAYVVLFYKHCSPQQLNEIRDYLNERRDSSEGKEKEKGQREGRV